MASVTIEGRRVALNTTAVTQESGSRGAQTAKSAAAVGAVGAIIGAIAGGGKGAAIGGAIGGAAGAGGAMATRGKHAELPSETRLTFRLSEPVTLTERLP
ncbi:MAG: hypothetical protein N2036_01230 [Bryobacteraceae bacterium]|nr:hypothetical protein [Bryobacteraceae bacterium]